MDMTFDITATSLLTVAGGSAFVGLILLTLRGVLKESWSETINRYATLALSLLLVEGIIAGSLTTDWLTYVLGFFVACQITLAVLNGTEIVSKGIARSNPGGRFARANAAVTAKRIAKAKPGTVRLDS